MHEEDTELSHLSGVPGVKLTVQEGAQDDFSFLCQLAVGPFSLSQSGHGGSCLTDALV